MPAKFAKKTFKTLNDARTHSQGPCGNIKQKGVVIDIEESVESHKCNACLTSYNSNDDLEEHMEKHHNRTFRCTTCSTTFESHNNLVSHLRTVHLKKDQNLEEGPLQNENSKCHHCDYITKTECC